MKQLVNEIDHKINKEIDRAHDAAEIIREEYGCAGDFHASLVWRGRLEVIRNCAEVAFQGVQELQLLRGEIPMKAMFYPKLAHELARCGRSRRRSAISILLEGREDVPTLRRILNEEDPNYGMFHRAIARMAETYL